MKTMLMSLILGFAPLIALAGPCASNQGACGGSNQQEKLSDANLMGLLSGVSDPGSLLFFAEKKVGGLACYYSFYSKMGGRYKCSLDENFDAKAIYRFLNVRTKVDSFEDHHTIRTGTATLVVTRVREVPGLISCYKTSTSITFHGYGHKKGLHEYRCLFKEDKITSPLGQQTHEKLYEALAVEESVIHTER